MKKYLFLIGLLLLIPTIVNASSTATVNITSSSGSAKQGDIITVNVNIKSSTPIGYYTYTLDYNPNKLKLLSGSSYVVDRPNDSNTKSVKKTFKFKVTGTGTYKISIKSYNVSTYGDEKMDVNINPLTISNSSIISSITSSDNNYLSSLKIDNYTLSPKFNKKTTSYKLEVPDSTENINVTAKAESKSATVTGTGEFSLLEGDNKIEVIVTSENGNDRIYTIMITTGDKNPINVKLDGKNYTLVKNSDALNIPDNYRKIKITIDGQEIGALYNEFTKYTLVGLKDEEGNISLYIYDEENKSYTPYKEIVTNAISFIPIETDEKLDGYSKYEETINDIDVNCYKTSSDSDYCIIYGMNLKNGDKGWYSYNKKENTIQKFNNSNDKAYEEKINNTKILIYILSGTTLIFAITTIVLAIKLNSRKR